MTIIRNVLSPDSGGRRAAAAGPCVGCRRCRGRGCADGVRRGQRQRQHIQRNQQRGHQQVSRRQRPRTAITTSVPACSSITARGYRNSSGGPSRSTRSTATPRRGRSSVNAAACAWVDRPLPLTVSRPFRCPATALARSPGTSEISRTATTTWSTSTTAGSWTCRANRPLMTPRYSCGRTTCRLPSNGGSSYPLRSDVGPSSRVCPSADTNGRAPGRLTNLIGVDHASAGRDDRREAGKTVK